MSKNTKQSSTKLAAEAARVLKDKNASKIKKEFAGSVLAQANTGKETGKEMEAKASKALKNKKYDDETKSFAGSLVSQSNKKR